MTGSNPTIFHLETYRQGTGFGLCLAFGSVMNGHGGMPEVESKEGEGTEFIVKLPC
ncbi:MAG: hypothetical protein IPN29_21125 [Saprospiraceae bacterium]|nr:hypothetical protein [Saprospiraceae bacterium]